MVIGEFGIYNNIFSGGLNNPEIQFVDIDADDDSDLFVLNSDGTFDFYLNKGNRVQPNFELQPSPPTGLILKDWFYFVDIDEDNDFDYFTSNGSVVSFYENIGNELLPNFILNSDTLKDVNGQIIYAEFGSNPLLADIDSDGDYDFFFGNTAGTVTFYENIGTPQQFIFNFVTNFWQNILIIGTAKNSENKHGASSLEFFDYENDGDLDLLWGDFFSNSLYFLKNNGNPFAPEMQLISKVFPINQDSVNTQGFNMPRVVDIDGDSDLDLFVSVLYDPTVKQSLMFYENIGNQNSPNYFKVSEDYCNTFDVGNNSHSVFIDINSDGDNDLFVGSLNNPLGTIWYFENTGNSSQPQFQLVTKQFSGINKDLSVVPAFGDIDGDGDFDLFVGKFDGTIEFYLNTGDRFNYNFVSQGILRDNISSVIDIGTSSTPFLFDFDSDNDLDLICGAFNGKLYYYKNTGTSENFSFEYVPTFFQIIDVGDNSTPEIIDFDNDGTNDLFIGNREGKIFYFKNAGTNEFPAWQHQQSEFEEFDFGGFSQITFTDIDNDSDLDAWIGNVKGGIYFFRNTTINSVKEINNFSPDEFQLEIYPNPSNSRVQLLLKSNSSDFVTIDIYNILGEKIENIYSGSLNSGNHTFVWEAERLNNNNSSGVFFAFAKTNKKIVSKKFILLK
ncbi:PKD repeat protein [Ignavibacterium album JCM 16511]|uniref:PKD repeat protein n=1 Tax=Ignavibacterium album (strain DSM 19864 / JCM 16511 / NBRC 101810 / Mat9-16) TaxID=945713 RepID=I0AII8_IGNAJ|nr:FG-GAP-like repeat-containing protein [Ignavibacterium album]AFH48795.1 PKD repeat protein [Ignavibacterium album JCM 16511]